VRLSKPHVDPVTVDYATEDDYAAAPGDYAETSGTLTFVPGDISEAVTVPVQGDTLDEFAEAFFLNLSNPVDASIADGSAAATIRDDDPTPGLSVDDVTVTEAASGTTTARFTVSLSAPSGKTVLADYSTADGTARVADGDYAESSGTLTFRPGATSRTVSVPVNSDAVSEPDEDFFLDLSGALNATLADGQGEGTVKDAPPPADTTAPDTRIDKGPSGLVNSRSASFEFSSPDDASATFECSLDGGEFAKCESGVSYNALSDGDHVFQVRAKDAAGNTDQAVAEQRFKIDATAPKVSVSPANATTAPKTTMVIATFDEEMDKASINSGSLKLEKVSSGKLGTTYTAVPAQFIYDPATDTKKDTLDPDKDLGNGTYRVTVSGGVKDIAGNTLGENQVASFKVGR